MAKTPPEFPDWKTCTEHIVAEMIEASSGTLKTAFLAPYSAVLSKRLDQVELTPARMDLLRAQASDSLRDKFDEAAQDRHAWTNKLVLSFQDPVTKALTPIRFGLDLLPETETMIFKGLVNLEATLPQVRQNYRLILDLPEQGGDAVSKVLKRYDSLMPVIAHSIEELGQELGYTPQIIAEARLKAVSAIAEGAEHLRPIPPDAWREAAPR